MVQGLDEVAPARVGRLVEDLSTAQLADAYLDTKRRQCTDNTIRNYRWALGYLERVYPTLSRVSDDIIHFVRNEPFQIPDATSTTPSGPGHGQECSL